jgi:hypothetical protein
MRGLVEGQKVSYEVQADWRTSKESAPNLKSAWSEVGRGRPLPPIRCRPEMGGFLLLL